MLRKLANYTTTGLGAGYFYLSTRSAEGNTPTITVNPGFILLTFPDCPDDGIITLSWEGSCHTLTTYINYQVNNADTETVQFLVKFFGSDSEYLKVTVSGFPGDSPFPVWIEQWTDAVIGGGLQIDRSSLPRIGHANVIDLGSPGGGIGSLG